MDMDKLKVPIDCPFVYLGEMSGDIIFCFEIEGENCNICTPMQDACPAVLQIGCAVAALYWRKKYEEIGEHEICATDRLDEAVEAREQSNLWQAAAFSGDEP